ncbi:MAG: DMT family transporter [Ruminococcaceae bacterium]|nr:DMT family transporter [Oscillospiraceae bacterium]
MKTKPKSVVLLFLTAIIWGFAFVAQKVGAQYVGAFTFNGIRFALGSLSLFPVIMLFEKEKQTKESFIKTLKAGVICGVVLFIASTLQQMGVEITNSAGKSGFITGLYTVFVPIAAFLFMKKKTNILTWIGAVLAVGGLYLLCMTGEESVGIGDLVLLLGTVFWTVHILAIDKYMIDGISPLRFSQMQFAVCAVLSIICALIFEDISFIAIKSALLPILYGGFMSVGIAYTCQVLGQKEADPTFAAIVLSTESVFGAIGGVLLAGESMTISAYIGCALIFAGIVLSQLKLKKKSQ